MDKAKIVHQVRRLAIASDSFQQCMSVLEHMEKIQLSIESDLYTPMMAGVVVTYTKNFNQADGLGPLPGFFTQFSEPDLLTAHSKLIESRNTLYAHRDSKAHNVRRGSSFAIPYPVQVSINKDNTAFLFQPHLVDIPPTRIPSIRKLLHFQLRRLSEDLDSKLAKVLNFEQWYEQGRTYWLGEDFP